jgi:flagellar hook assembly protein FlgD
LAQNYPNPFNPVTTIRYQVKQDGPVKLRIYNVAGQLIRTLVNDTVKAGVVHEVQWKGLNDTGSPVASGVYFYRLVAGDYTQTRKMVVLK